jgi:hypothetical protein
MSALENALPKPKIELYSGKYFVACGLGGIIGSSNSFLKTTYSEASELIQHQSKLSAQYFISVSL